MWPFKKKQVAAPEPVKEQKPEMRIRAEAVAEIQAKPPREIEQYKPPKGVIPESIEKGILAMDSTPYGALNEAYMGYMATLTVFLVIHTLLRSLKSLSIARWLAPSPKR